MGSNSVVNRTFNQVKHTATHLSDVTHPGANTVLGQAGHMATHLSDWGQLFGVNKPDDPQQAGAPPTQQNTTQQALQNQVSQESRARWDQTMFAGNTTNLVDTDAAPKNTASRVLLGGS